jgi:hypothetical protein
VLESVLESTLQVERAGAAACIHLRGAAPFPAPPPAAASASARTYTRCAGGRSALPTQMTRCWLLSTYFSCLQVRWHCCSRWHCRCWHCCCWHRCPPLKRGIHRQRGTPPFGWAVVGLVVVTSRMDFPFRPVSTNPPGIGVTARTLASVECHSFQCPLPQNHPPSNWLVAIGSLLLRLPPAWCLGADRYCRPCTQPTMQTSLLPSPQTMRF